MSQSSQDACQVFQLMTTCPSDFGNAVSACTRWLQCLASCTSSNHCHLPIGLQGTHAAAHLFNFVPLRSGVCLPVLLSTTKQVPRTSCTVSIQQPMSQAGCSYCHMHTRIGAGTRPSRLRNSSQAGDREPNQVSTSSPIEGSPQNGPTVMTHPHLKSLTVRTHVLKSEPSSDGTGSARTPGSVNIRVWKVYLSYIVGPQAQ